MTTQEELEMLRILHANRAAGHDDWYPGTQRNCSGCKRIEERIGKLETVLKNASRAQAAISSGG
jgi:hypothetical protein